MFQFDKISLKQILVFSEIVNESTLLHREFLKDRFMKYAQNFDETVDFLKGIELVLVKSNQIIPQPKYKAFLKHFSKSRRQEEIMQEFVVTNLVGQENGFSAEISEFLFQFKLVNESYVFIPNASQRLKYSGLRNFLIDIGFIHLDSNESK